MAASQTESAAQGIAFSTFPADSQLMTTYIAETGTIRKLNLTLRADHGALLREDQTLWVGAYQTTL
jgi:hypothetical protein